MPCIATVFGITSRIISSASWDTTDPSAQHRKTRLPEKNWSCAHLLPLGPPQNFTVTTFIEGCTRFDPGRSDIAADFLRCSSSSSLSYLAGLVSSSFPAESSALVHGLEWCHFHLKSCHFWSALFLMDSHSATTLLSSAPAFLQPKSFWNIWDLSDSLSFRVALSFQWIPGYAGFPGNERADSLAKTGATLPVEHVPCPLAPTIAKVRHTCYSLWKQSLS